MMFSGSEYKHRDCWENHTNFMAFVHQQSPSGQSSNSPTSPVHQVVIFLLRSLRHHFRLLICRAHGSASTGMHLCVLGGWRSTGRVPATLTRLLVDEEPATVRGIPFGYPAGRKVVIGAGRGRRTVEGTFTCMLIDADQRSAHYAFYIVMSFVMNL